MGATQLGVAVPNFWFAMMLVLVFAINLRWFSAGGFAGWDEGFWGGHESLTCPPSRLALPQAAILARVMRSRPCWTCWTKTFMRTARAKGLTVASLWRHGVRNALIPVLTIIWLAVLVLCWRGRSSSNRCFTCPALGGWCSKPFQPRDLIVVEVVVMLLVFAVIVVNFAVDLAYAAVDPRLRART